MSTMNPYALLGPAILGLILFEFLYCLVKKNGYYSFQDSLMGLGTMILAQCVNVGIAAAVIAGYGYVYNHFAVSHIEATPLTILGCYVGVDFLFYWFHRAGHRINILWAAHATHHSAEELNYAVALRTSVLQRAASFIFYVPLALIGFEPSVIVPIVAFNLILQLIPHTRLVPRLPAFIDAWLNTPYHHRIHHAANPVYWDKNYGGTFIFWDKFFGTYQDEVEPIYYGITIHPRSWDPTWLNLHWLSVLWKDARAATHLADAFKIWFMPPGWRPRNLPPFEKLPAKSAENQVKYQTVPLKNSQPYLLLQLVILMSSLFLVISPHSPLGIVERIVVSGLLWWGVTQWGAILESKSSAKPVETIRVLISTLLISTMLITKDRGMASGLLVIFGGLISFLFVLKFLGNADASAQEKNALQKLDPDYRKDWKGRAPVHSSYSRPPDIQF
jgi:alkylglycerol monooxygenase